MASNGPGLALAVKYHAWWPSGSDPYYTYNTSENQARIYYYGVQNIGVPHVMVDGLSSPNPWNAALIQSAINSRFLVPSPCTMEVTTENVTSTTVDVTVRLTAEQDMLSSSNRLYVALKHVCHSWGGTHWYPFRDMEPSTSGESFQIPADCTLVYSTTFTFSGSFESSDMRIVAFAQNYSSKEVYQSAYADLGAPDINLVINELMSNNSRYATDPQGENADWVEIFNPGPDDVNLSGYYLTNDLSDPDMWTFPDTLLPVENYLVVWCDGDIGDAGIHTNFELERTGGELGLFMPPGLCHSLVIDQVVFPGLDEDWSYGRVCDGSSIWETFMYATIGATNSGCSENIDSLVALVSGTDLQLFWEPVDWAVSYTVYRHNTFPMDPATADSITTVSDTTYIDTGILSTESNAFYRVTARPY